MGFKPLNLSLKALFTVIIAVARGICKQRHIVLE